MQDRGISVHELVGLHTNGITVTISPLPPRSCVELTCLIDDSRKSDTLQIHLPPIYKK